MPFFRRDSASSLDAPPAPSSDDAIPLEPEPSSWEPEAQDAAPVLPRRVVLHDAGPHPEVVVDRLVTLGCPPDAARWFIHSCSMGETPDIVMEPTMEEATDLVADLADLGATAKILGGGPAPLSLPPSPPVTSPAATSPAATSPSVTPMATTSPSVTPMSVTAPTDAVNGTPVATEPSNGYEPLDTDLADILGVHTNGHHFEGSGDADALSPTTPPLPEAPPAPPTNGHAGPSAWMPQVSLPQVPVPVPPLPTPQVPLPPVPAPPLPAPPANPLPRVITMPPWPAHLPTASSVAPADEAVADAPPADEVPAVPRTRPLYSMFTPETTRVTPRPEPAVEETDHTPTLEAPLSGETPAPVIETPATAEPPAPALTPVRALAPVDVVHELATAYRAGDAMSVADCFRPDAVIYIGRDRVVATGRDEIQEHYERVLRSAQPGSAGLLARIVSGPWVIDHEGADTLSCYRVDGGYITELLMLEPGVPPI